MDFITINEAAKILKVTRQTVSGWIKTKELKAVKLNKSYRIDSADFRNFLRERYNGGTNGSLSTENTRNCHLYYPEKSPATNILESPVAGSLSAIKIEHPDRENMFIFGDNLLAMKHLLKDYKGMVDLIYIDPPFGTGQNFSSLEDDLAYSDKLVNHQFLEFFRQRLILLREFLSEEGSIYVHIDKQIGHYVKIIMDEVFGYQNFINDISRIKCNPKNFSRKAYGNYSDMILFYAKRRDQNIFNNIQEPLHEDEVKKLFPKKHPRYGRYTTHPLHAPGKTINGDTGLAWKGLMPPRGRHWRYSRDVLTELDNNGLVEWSDSGNPRKMVFAKDHLGKKVQDVWLFKDRGLSYVDYPTQKNHDLLRRIILNSSNKNSLVLDCFAGSGGTLSISHELGRRWIGIDRSPQSFQVISEKFSNDKVRCNYFRVE